MHWKEEWRDEVIALFGFPPTTPDSPLPVVISPSSHGEGAGGLFRGHSGGNCGIGLEI